MFKIIYLLAKMAKNNADEYLLSRVMWHQMLFLNNWEKYSKENWLLHNKDARLSAPVIRLGRYIEISILSTVSNWIEIEALTNTINAFPICKKEKKDGPERDSIQRPAELQAIAFTTRPQGLLISREKFVSNDIGLRNVVMVIISLTPKLSCGCGRLFLSLLWTECRPMY